MTLGHMGNAHIVAGIRMIRIVWILNIGVIVEKQMDILEVLKNQQKNQFGTTIQLLPGLRNKNIQTSTKRGKE